ncbi:MAG: hypothetical protein Q4D51_13195 [Eubacteriales bacterium]|nr:hypothetical protein [Eubacteriales bacterium]
MSNHKEHTDFNQDTVEINYEYLGMQSINELRNEVLSILSQAVSDMTENEAVLLNNKGDTLL